MKQYLGIEFGSTRIKAVAVDENHKPLSSGDYTWKNWRLWLSIRKS